MSENNGELLKGLIIGGLAGMLLGILLAPKSGKELREDLAAASDSAVRRLKEMEAAAEKKMEDAGKKVSDLAQQGKETIQDNRDRLKKALDAGVEAFREGRE